MRNEALAALTLFTLLVLPRDAGLALASLDLHYAELSFDCVAGELPSSCSQVVVNHPSPGEAVYQLTVLAQLCTQDGAISAAQFGVDYESAGQVTGVFTGWTTCNGAPYVTIDGPNGAWPASGSAVAVRFDDCVVPSSEFGFVPIGVLPVLAASPAFGLVDVIPDPVTDLVALVTCEEFQVGVSPENRGSFSFGGNSGREGCPACAIPVESVTWSRVKASF